MKMYAFMIPAIFCGAVSFAALLGVAGSMMSKPMMMLFYASLPAPFVVVGGLMYQMDREISRLRRRIARMEQKSEQKPGDPRSLNSAERDRNDQPD